MSAPIDWTGPIYFDWSRGVRTPARGERMVYAIEFQEGVVKVGQSQDLSIRLSGNCSDIRARGLKLIRYFARPTSFPNEDERDGLAAARETGAPWMHGREWFQGSNFEHVMRAIGFVPTDIPTERVA